MTWVRPSHVQFPNTWKEFEGKVSKRKFWIQDITDEFKELIINYIVYNFTAEETLSKRFRVHTYPDALKSFSSILNKVIEDRCGLVCLTKDRNGKIQVAAINCNFVVSIKDSPMTSDVEVVTKIIELTKFLGMTANPFEKFNVDQYLGAIALYVLPQFRRDGIATAILQAREPLCEAIGIKVSCTSFSSEAAQAAAEKAGFKEYYSTTLANLEEVNENWKVADADDTMNLLKSMYIMYN